MSNRETPPTSSNDEVISDTGHTNRIFHSGSDCVDGPIGDIENRSDVQRHQADILPDSGSVSEGFDADLVRKIKNKIECYETCPTDRPGRCKHGRVDTGKPRDWLADLKRLLDSTKVFNVIPEDESEKST